MLPANDIQALSHCWQETCRSAGVSEDAARPVFADLEERYSHPIRFYHTLAHVAAMLQTANDLERRMAVPDIAAVRLAVWFHDAVYDTRAADNEERSAEYAAAVLGRQSVSEPTLGAVRRLIIATKAHQVTPDDTDGQVMVDADLAILGAPAAEYEGYVHAVRREYAWVSEPDWRTGRSRVLASFLQRPLIYHTPPMRDMREDAARRNLHRELESLS